MPTETDRLAIETVYRSLVKYLLSRDYESARELYFPHGVYVTSPGEVTNTESDLMVQLERFTDIIAKMSLIKRSIYIAEDTALVKVDWHWQDAPQNHQLAIDVLRKTEAGQWRFVIDNPMGL